MKIRCCAIAAPEARATRETWSCANATTAEMATARATAPGKAAKMAAASETASATARTCPRWLTKTDKTRGY
jgi:hypothetical protein